MIKKKRFYIASSIFQGYTYSFKIRSDVFGRKYVHVLRMGHLFKIFFVSMNEVHYAHTLSERRICST